MSGPIDDSEDDMWNRGAFDEGAKARIDGFNQRHAPTADVVGQFARRSWMAGWADADAGIRADGLIDKFPVQP